jgi:hypothetical protein
MSENQQDGLLDPPNLQTWFEQKFSDQVWQSAKILDEADTWVPDSAKGTFFAVLQTMAQYFNLHQGQAGVFIEDENMWDFIQVLAYTRTSPSIRLLGLLGQCQPGLGGDVVKTCETSKVPGHQLEAESKVVLARIKLLARMECYNQIFGPERRKEVLAILDEMQQEGGRTA